MSSMKSLMEFSMVNNIPSPMKSMELLIASQKSTNASIPSSNGSTSSSSSSSSSSQVQAQAQGQNLANFSGSTNLQTDAQRSQTTTTTTTTTTTAATTTAKHE